MWDDPRRLNILTGVISTLAVVVLLATAVSWTIRQSVFGIHRVTVVDRLTHVNPAHLDQLGDAVVVQIGSVRADADIHLGPAKGANHGKEVRVDSGLAAGQRHTSHPAIAKPGHQDVLHVGQGHR